MQQETIPPTSLPDEVQNRVFPIRTDEEKAFVAVAVQWTANDGRVYCVDTRAERTLRLGFNAKEQVITPHGLATFIGVEIDGSLLFEVCSSSAPVNFSLKTKADFDKLDFHPIRTDAEKAFVAVAVEWTSKNDGDICTVDTRSESTLPLGFRPNEQVITTSGLATVIGVAINGALLFEVVRTLEAVIYPYSAEDFQEMDFYPIRTEEDEMFVAVAVEWTGKDEDIYTLDTRPEALNAIGFIPNERAVTWCGLATVIGLNIKGRLGFEVVSTSELIFSGTTKEELELASVRPIRTDEEKAFVAVAVEWSEKNADADAEKDSAIVSLIDIRPEATLPLGFHPNECVITPADGLATVIGVDINGKVLCEINRSQKPIFYPFTTREEFEKNEFHPIRTDEDKAFVAVAEEWTANDGRVYCVDTRTETTLRLGFYPSEYLTTPFGLVKVIGVEINGCSSVVEIKHNLDTMRFAFTKEDLEKNGYRAMRSKEEKAFAAVAVEWTGKDGANYTLDTRPEATLSLGFAPNERVITPDGLATVIGVDVRGFLFFDLIRGSTTSPRCFEYKTKAEFEEDDFRAIRTNSEKRFASLSVDWTSNDGVVHRLNRSAHMMLFFGFRPKETVITPHGLATVVGVDIDNCVLFELKHDSETISYAYKTKERFVREGIHPVHTEEEKQFLARATEWRVSSSDDADSDDSDSDDGYDKVFFYDPRPEATLVFGLEPNDQLITYRGLATVMGVAIDGFLILKINRTDKAMLCPCTTKAQLDKAHFPVIRTDKDRDFAAVAVAVPVMNQRYRHRVVTVDTRPAGALLSFGLIHNERFITPDGLATAIGVDIDDNLLYTLISSSSTAECSMCKASKKDFSAAGCRTSQNYEERRFMAVAVNWTPKEGGNVDVLDTRPETTLALGFYPNELILTAVHGLGTVIGVDIDGKLILSKARCAMKTTLVYSKCTREALQDAGYVAMRTDAQKAFAAVAVEWTANDGDVYLLDTRPEALNPFGFYPNERVISPDGLSTIIGVDIDGDLQTVVLATSKPIVYDRRTKEEFKKDGFHTLRTNAKKAFAAVAVEWKAKDGNTYVLDTCPEALLPLGFLPNERVISPEGLATIIGVDIEGDLLIEHISDSKPIAYARRTKEEFEEDGFRTLRTDVEKAFAAVAVEWKAKNDDVYVLDTRPEALLPLGFRPNERVISPEGQATIIGVDIEGDLLFELITDSKPIGYARRTKEEFEKDGFRTLRSDAEKAFAAVAAEHRKRFDEADVVLLDCRPEILHKMGFSDLREGFHQSSAPIFTFTVAGLDINGDLYFYQHAKDFGKYGVFRVPRGLKTRAECVAKFFDGNYGAATHVTTQLSTVVEEKGRKPASRPTRIGISQTVVSATTSNRSRSVLAAAAAAACARSSAARRKANPLGSPAANVKTAGHKPATTKNMPLATTAAQSYLRTVTLPLGAVYRGAHTRTGQRRGNGTMRGADRSWRYKGQWQQGWPHGSGTLWMTIGPTEAVYEGRWVLGVPHGRGTLRVECVSEKRRYRGRWACGRRAMTAAEVATARLSGGTAFAIHRPAPAVPTKVDASKKNQKKRATTTKVAPAAPALAPVVFAKHDEVQRMVAAVAAACSLGHAVSEEPPRTTSNTIKYFPSSPAETKKIPREGCIRALRQFLLL